MVWGGGASAITHAGPPLAADGSYAAGNLVYDNANIVWLCTVSGVPGTWVAIGGQGDLINPMTTLGDHIYGGAAGAATRLAGNITTTRQFLAQTGTGAISAAPVLTALAASDIPDLGVWQPADNGLLVANMDPAAASSTIAVTAGTRYLLRVAIRKAITWTNTIVGLTANGNNTGGSTGTFVALYDSGGNLLSNSADAATLFTSGAPTEVVVPLVTPQALAAGVFVYVAILCNLGTTQPTFQRSAANPAALSGVSTATAFRAAVNGTVQTTMPASLTLANSVQTNSQPIWVGAT